MKRLILFVLLLFVSNLISAQSSCSLTSFSYEIKIDGDVFYIIIEEPGDINDDYMVVLNEMVLEGEGKRFGPFEKDCSIFYSLAITDRENELCGAKINIGHICNADPICRIGEIEYSVSECNPNNVVEVKFDFEYANVSDSFYLKGNGILYGQYAYKDLPISVSPIIGECNKEFEFVVVDSKNEDCQQFVDDIRICCDNNCNPPIFEIVNQECDSAHLYLKLELLEDLTNSNLQIILDGDIISDYEVDYPYIYLRAKQNYTSLVHMVAVCTVGIADVCCFEQEFDLSDCFGKECFLGDISYDVIDCENSEGAYISLDFKYENTISEHFYVRGNGTNYGTFKYSELPVEIGPFSPACDIIYELSVVDSIDNSCTSSIDNLNICCEQTCLEPIFEIVSRECFDNNFALKLELINPLFSNAITVLVNGEETTSYEIDFPYIYVKGENNPNNVNQISICTAAHNGSLCCYSQNFDLDCGNNGECRIGDLSYTTLDCASGQETFILLDFKYENTASENFIVGGNGTTYGTFAYSDLPVKVGPFEANCDILYELEVVDSKDEECSSFLEEVAFCCDDICHDALFEIVGEECYNASYILKLELLKPHDSNQVFVILNGKTIDTYEVEYPFIYVKSEFDTLEVNELTLCTLRSDGNECCFTQQFILDCENNEACKIGDIKVEAGNCLDTDLPGFFINFEYKNVGKEGFSLRGNGRDYGDYKYESLPIFVNVEDNCSINYEFVIVDNELDCSNSVEYGQFCCASNCSFEIDDSRIRCNDGIISEIAFFLFEETDPIKKYSVYANGELIGETSENNIFLEFPVELEINSAEGLELTVCDENCCVSQKLDLSDCITPPVECSISNVRTSQITCGGNGLDFKLNFDHSGTSSEEFDVFSIFGKVGTYKYSDLPIKVEDFPAVNIGLNVLFICDAGSFCCQAHLFSSPFCLNIGGFDRVNDLDRSSNRYIKQNPVDYNLILDSPYEQTKYQILDSSGQVIKQIKSNNFVTQIDVSGLSSGMYLVRIENIGEIKIEKLIITN